MNDIFTPPAASETACRQRGAFRSAAVEAALAALVIISNRLMPQSSELIQKLCRLPHIFEFISVDITENFIRERRTWHDTAIWSHAQSGINAAACGMASASPDITVLLFRP